MARVWLFCCPLDLKFAECMKNLLGAVDVKELMSLLERSQEVAQGAAVIADQDAVGG